MYITFTIIIIMYVVYVRPIFENLYVDVLF